jgi:hypothetical protein
MIEARQLTKNVTIAVFEDTNQGREGLRQVSYGLFMFNIYAVWEK